MSTYTSRDALVTQIPPAFLLEALDDDNDGTEDSGLLAALLASVDDEVDGYLEARHSLPLPTVPRMVATAALHLACEALYARRGYHADSEPRNPWSGRADSARALLRAIRAGEQPLQIDIPKADPQISVISEPAPLHSSSGRRLT